MVEICDAAMVASGGATDGTEWVCQLKAGHNGQHVATYQLACGRQECTSGIDCEVLWAVRHEHTD